MWKQSGRTPEQYAITDAVREVFRAYNIAVRPYRLLCCLQGIARSGSLTRVRPLLLQREVEEAAKQEQEAERNRVYDEPARAQREAARLQLEEQLATAQAQRAASEVRRPPAAPVSNLSPAVVCDNRTQHDR